MVWGGSVAAGRVPGRGTAMVRRRDGGEPGAGRLWQAAVLLLSAALVASALAAAGDVGGGRLPAEVSPVGALPDAGTGVARIRFELPRADAGHASWVVWVPRVARESVWLEGDGWR